MAPKLTSSKIRFLLLHFSGNIASPYLLQLDCLVQYDDGTFGVIDFKTSSASRSAQMYGRQLHAYARAIESPSPASELIQGTVTDLGLVVYEPCKFTALDPSGAAMTGGLTYIPIERDDAAFDKFLSEIMDVVSLEQPPRAPKKTGKPWSGSVTCCPYCQYLHDANDSALNEVVG